MSDSPFHPENMRRRFHELGRLRQTILAQSMPLREVRDRLTQETDAKLRPMNADIQAMETGLFDIDMERGMLARALDGKTGRPE